MAGCELSRVCHEWRAAVVMVKPETVMAWVASSQSFQAKAGSSGWIRTSNPPVNRLMQVVYPIGSSMVYLTPHGWYSPVFGSQLFTDCSLRFKSRARNQHYLQLWRPAA